MRPCQAILVFFFVLAAAPVFVSAVNREPRRVATTTEGEALRVLADFVFGFNHRIAGLVGSRWRVVQANGAGCDLAIRPLVDALSHSPLSSRLSISSITPKVLDGRTECYADVSLSFGTEDGVVLWTFQDTFVIVPDSDGRYGIVDAPLTEELFCLLGSAARTDQWFREHAELRQLRR